MIEHGRSTRLPLYSAGTAIALSLSAFAIVVGNVAAGVPPQPDENMWAHLFQLGMAAQLPLFLLSVATVDRVRAGLAITLIAAQLSAAGAAFGALWWSGY